MRRSWLGCLALFFLAGAIWLFVQGWARERESGPPTLVEVGVADGLRAIGVKSDWAKDVHMRRTVWKLREMLNEARSEAAQEP
jgi:hypothetical protein